MASNSESFISVFTDVNWRGTVSQNPKPLHVDSESFKFGQEFIERETKTRQGRAYNSNATGIGPRKPSAEIEYQPRSADLEYFLYAHYQNFQEIGTDGGVFTPSKVPPTYGYTGGQGNGSYSSSGGEVYSVSFLKKYFDSTGADNAHFFERGICDSLTFSSDAGEDLKVKSTWKFKNVETGTEVSYRPNSTGAGTYESQAPFFSFEGTVNIGGNSFDLLGMEITSKNNLIEKMVVGAQNPDSFQFRDFEITGNFTMDFPKDGMEQIGSMVAISPVSISGTWYKAADEYVIVSLPHVERRNFDIPINDKNIDVSIPFKAFTDGDEPPVFVTLKKKQPLLF